MHNHYLYVITLTHDSESECLGVLEKKYTNLNKVIYHLMERYKNEFGGVYHDKQGSTYIDLIDNNEMLTGTIKIETVSALIKNK